MNTLDAIKLLCDIAEATMPVDPDLAAEHALAVRTVRNYAYGWFPGYRQSRIAAGLRTDEWPATYSEITHKEPNT